MRKLSIVVAASALAAITFSVFQWGPSVASFASGAAQVDANIVSSTRLDVTASTAPGTHLAVAGDSDGARLEVDIPGPVTLTTQTQALLAGQRDCTYTPGGRLVITPDGGTFSFSAGPSGGSFKAHNFGLNVDYVSCWPRTGLTPLPNCLTGDGGIGFDLHNRETAEIDLATGLAWQVTCITCVHTGGPAQDDALVTGVLSTCTPPQ